MKWNADSVNVSRVKEDRTNTQNLLADKSTNCLLIPHIPLLLLLALSQNPSPPHQTQCRRPAFLQPSSAQVQRPIQFARFAACCSQGQTQSNSVKSCRKPHQNSTEGSATPILAPNKQPPPLSIFHKLSWIYRDKSHTYLAFLWINSISTIYLSR